jgi:MoxR-like ATPase
MEHLAGTDKVRIVHLEDALVQLSRGRHLQKILGLEVRSDSLNEQQQSDGDGQLLESAVEFYVALQEDPDRALPDDLALEITFHGGYDNSLYKFPSGPSGFGPTREVCAQGTRVLSASVSYRTHRRAVVGFEEGDETILFRVAVKSRGSSAYRDLSFTVQFPLAHVQSSVYIWQHHAEAGLSNDAADFGHLFSTFFAACVQDTSKGPAMCLARVASLMSLFQVQQRQRVLDRMAEMAQEVMTNDGTLQAHCANTMTVFACMGLLLLKDCDARELTPKQVSQKESKNEFNRASRGAPEVLSLLDARKLLGKGDSVAGEGAAGGGLASSLGCLQEWLDTHAATTTPVLGTNGRIVSVQIPALIREAVQVFFDLGTSMRVPTYEFLWAMPVLESLGVVDRSKKLHLDGFTEEGLSAIPSFNAEKPKPGVMAPMLLKRSVSLLERESSWKVAYDSCENLKKRIQQAQQALQQERARVISTFRDIERSGAEALSSADWSGLEQHLAEARERAFDALKTLERATEVDPQLQNHLEQLSKQGEELRQKTIRMIKVFGPEIGHDEKTEDYMSTMAGRADGTASFRDDDAVGGISKEQKKEMEELEKTQMSSGVDIKDAMRAGFSAPAAVAQLPDGRFVVADARNSAIRLVSADGTVSTLIGRCGPGHLDGPAHVARVSRPEGIVVLPMRFDRAGKVYGGNVLIADTGNGVVRALSRDLRYVITLAGMPGFLGHRDGSQENAAMTEEKKKKKHDAPGTTGTGAKKNPKQARAEMIANFQGVLFRTPAAIAELQPGELLVADTDNRCLRLVRFDADVDAEIERRLPWRCGGCDHVSDICARECSRCQRKKDKYVTVDWNDTVPPSVKGAVEVVTIAGNPAKSGLEDSKREDGKSSRGGGDKYGGELLTAPTSLCVLHSPFAVNCAKQDILQTPDVQHDTQIKFSRRCVFTDGNAIRLLDLTKPRPQVSTIAGDQLSGNEDGPTSEARFSAPQGIVELADGRLIVFDSRNHLLRLITPRFSPGLRNPEPHTLDLPPRAHAGAKNAKGAKYESRLKAGRVTLLAGQPTTARTKNGGLRGQSTDGVVSYCGMHHPCGGTLARDGSVVFADRLGNRLRRLLPVQTQENAEIQYRQDQLDFERATSALKEATKDASFNANECVEALHHARAITTSSGTDASRTLFRNQLDHLKPFVRAHPDSSVVILQAAILTAPTLVDLVHVVESSSLPGGDDHGGSGGGGGGGALAECKLALLTKLRTYAWDRHNVDAQAKDVGTIMSILDQFGHHLVDFDTFRIVLPNAQQEGLSKKERSKLPVLKASPADKSMLGFFDLLVRKCLSDSEAFQTTRAFVAFLKSNLSDAVVSGVSDWVRDFALAVAADMLKEKSKNAKKVAERTRGEDAATVVAAADQAQKHVLRIGSLLLGWSSMIASAPHLDLHFGQDVYDVDIATLPKDDADDPSGGFFCRHFTSFVYLGLESEYGATTPSSGGNVGLFRQLGNFAEGSFVHESGVPHGLWRLLLHMGKVLVERCDRGACLEAIMSGMPGGRRSGGDEKKEDPQKQPQGPTGADSSDSDASKEGRGFAVGRERADVLLSLVLELLGGMKGFECVRGGATAVAVTERLQLQFDSLMPNMHSLCRFIAWQQTFLGRIISSDLDAEDEMGLRGRHFQKHDFLAVTRLESWKTVNVVAVKIIACLQDGCRAINQGVVPMTEIEVCQAVRQDLQNAFAATSASGKKALLRKLDVTFNEVRDSWVELQQIKNMSLEFFQSQSSVSRTIMYVSSSWPTLTLNDVRFVLGKRKQPAGDVQAGLAARRRAYQQNLQSLQNKVDELGAKLRFEAIGPAWAALAEDKKKAEAQLAKMTREPPATTATAALSPATAAVTDGLLQPLPYIILASVPYLQRLASSGSFRALLSKASGDVQKGNGGSSTAPLDTPAGGELDAVVEAIRSWGQLYQGLTKGTFPLAALMDIYQPLMADIELDCLVKTGPAALAASVTDEDIAALVFNEDEELFLWVETLMADGQKSLAGLLEKDTPALVAGKAATGGTEAETSGTEVSTLESARSSADSSGDDKDEDDDAEKNKRESSGLVAADPPPAKPKLPPFVRSWTPAHLERFFEHTRDTYLLARPTKVQLQLQHKVRMDTGTVLSAENLVSLDNADGSSNSDSSEEDVPLRIATIMSRKLDVQKLTVGNPDNLWVFRVRKRLQRLKHLLNVKGQTDTLNAAVDVLARLSPPRDLPVAMKLKASIHEFLSYLDHFWDTLTFSDADGGEVMLRLSKISPEVMSIADPETGIGISNLRVLEASRKFVTWLRGLRVDADFSTSVEMAMGRTEMECPPELWIEQDDSVGRPDEEKLSMLTSVRNFLHRWIYNSHLADYSLFGNFMNVMRGVALLGPAPESFGGKLAECSRLHVPLQELLSDDTDNAAPNKLLQLLDRKSKARWVISTVPASISPSTSTLTSDDQQPKGAGSGSDPTAKEADTLENLLVMHNKAFLQSSRVCVEYLVPRKGMTMARKYEFQELIDFQSALVLAQGAQDSDEKVEDSMVILMKRFLRQFEIIVQLRNTIDSLKFAGHFFFQSFHLDFNFYVRMSHLDRVLKHHQEELEVWDKNLLQVRQCSLYLNFVSASLLCQFYRVMEALAANGAAADASNAAVHLPFFEEIMCSFRSVGVIQSDMSAAAVNSFVQRMVDFWKEHAAAALDSYDSSVLSAEAAAAATAATAAPADSLRLKPVIEFVAAVLKCGLEGFCNRESQDACDLFGTVAAGVQQSNNSAPPTSRAGGGDMKNALQILVTNSPNMAVDTLLSAFLYQSAALPAWDQVLVCSETTPFHEVENIILRWALGKRQLYAVAFMERLPFDVQKKATILLSNLLSELAAAAGARARDASQSPSLFGESSLFFIAGGGELGVQGSQFLAHFADYRTTLVPLSHSQMTAHCAQLLSKAKVFSSLWSGSGKTFSIRTEAQRCAATYVHVPINRAMSPLEFIQYLKHKLELVPDDSGGNGGGGGTQLWHFDVSDAVAVEFDWIMFELLFLGALRDHITGRSLHVDLTQTHICVEMGSPALLSKLHCCQFLANEMCMPGFGNFCVGEDGLRAGMGHMFDYMPETLLDKTIATAGINAGHRLNLVCNALKVREDCFGGFPLEFDVAYHERDLQGGLTAEDCFNLLLAASKQKIQSVSLWSLWGFINVLYWQVKEMHAPDSPVNLCFLPDPAIDVPKDSNLREKCKGEIVVFAMRTAVEFATRQRTDANENEIEWMRLQNHSLNLGGWWRKCHFDCANRPVYKQGTKLLYCNGDNWVVDERIRFSGQPMTMSIGTDIRGDWETPVPWVESDGMTVQSAGEDVVRVQGRSQKVRGTYTKVAGKVQQRGFKEKVEGHLHYISFEASSGGSAERRHLFYSTAQRRWILAPTCDDEGEVYARSPQRHASGSGFNDEYFGTGWEVPAGGADALSTGATTRENNFVITGYTDAKAQEEFLASSQMVTTTVAGDGGAELTSRAFEDHSDMVQAVKEMDDNLILGDLKPWAASNHEIMLFSAKTSAMFLLGLKAKRMRNTFHPSLLKYLEESGIEVGTDLNSDVASSTSHAILSTLTGIERTKSEATKLLKSTYCITGDCLIKMLGIYTRIKSGLPVVLMGECGCGKTMLLRYMCAWMNFKLIILDIHGGTTELQILKVFKDANKFLAQQQAQQDKEAQDWVAKMMTAMPNMTPEEATALREKTKDKAANNPKNAGVAAGDQNVMVFLDEMNTCPHTGLITEAICSRSLNGVPLSAKVHVLAACNPYRKRSEVGNQRMEGLHYEVRPDLGGGGGNAWGPFMQATAVPKSTEDIMRTQKTDDELVYRVHRIPLSLQEYIFDFGALGASEESMYVLSIVSERLHRLKAKEQSAISILLCSAQEYVRTVEGDPSVVSLRDIKRAVDLMRWFAKALQPAGPSAKKVDMSSMRALISPVILGIAHVYFFRLNADELRDSFWGKLRGEIKSFPYGSQRDAFEHLQKPGQMEHVLIAAKRQITKRFEVDEGIAMNHALEENLYVLVVCIVNRIPAFVVGKPGSSKTLAMQVLSNNLQGEQSPRKFWRRFPPVHLFQYQCSPMSTANGILGNFQRAVNYQRHAPQVLVVLLLDEVGLAEHSPDMPLKALHGMLVNPPVSIVGLSNWVLDSAKMNRAVCLHRPDPAQNDIQMTGKSLLGPDIDLPRQKAGTSGPEVAGGAKQKTRNKGKGVDLRVAASGIQLGKFLSPLASAYYSVYSLQKEGESRDFLGMRDFYHLIKLLRRLISNEERKGVHIKFSKRLLSYVCARNFGGKDELLHQVMETFQSNCFGGISTTTNVLHDSPAKLDLIRENLADHDARNLMILTSKGAALMMLISSGTIDPNCAVLVGGLFREDRSELRLVQQINKVKNAMASGATIVLQDCDEIYEALYDVLNQRYLVKTNSKTGRMRRMLRLAIGSRSQLCPVDRGFKVIVITEQEHAYTQLDLPLLNRFEKQLFRPVDVLNHEQKILVSILQEWVHRLTEMAGVEKPADLLAGFSLDTITTLVLSEFVFTDKRRATPLRKADGEDDLENADLGDGAALEPPMLNRTISGEFASSSKGADGGGAGDEEAAGKGIFQKDDAGAQLDGGLLSPQLQEPVFEEPAAASVRAQDQTSLKDKLAAMFQNRGGDDAMGSQLISDSSEFDDAVVNALKFSIARLAFPTSFFRGTHLDLTLSTSTYINDHANFSAAFLNVCLNPNPSPAEDLEFGDGDDDAHDAATANGLSFILTHSPTAHLREDILQMDPRLQERNCAVSLTRLSELSSEGQLHDLIETFFAGTSSECVPGSVAAAATATTAILILQCDPLSSSHALIRHAAYLCTSVRSRHKKEQNTPEATPANGEKKKTATRRHVVILVHMPPGAKNSMREYEVSFYPGWNYVFVDDIRTESTVTSSLTMERGMNNSLYALVERNEIDLKAIVLRRVSSILALCSNPVFMGEGRKVHSFVHRVRLLRGLFAEEHFYGIVHTTICAMLKALQSVGSSGLHSHVELAQGLLRAGSLRQSLQLALEVIVERACAVAVSSLDVDFNIDLLFEAKPTTTQPGGGPNASSVISKLWYVPSFRPSFLASLVLCCVPSFLLSFYPWVLSGFMLSFLSSARYLLVRNTDIVNGRRVAMRHTDKIMSSSHKRVEVLNNGQHGPHAARFPFSHKVSAMLGSPDLLGLIANNNSNTSTTTADDDDANKVVAEKAGYGTDGRVLSKFQEQLEELGKGMFGEEVSMCWTEDTALFLRSGEGDADAADASIARRFLHDFVACRGNAHVGLPFAAKFGIYNRVVSASAGASASGTVSPPHILASIFYSGERISHLCSLAYAAFRMSPPLFEALLEFLAPAPPTSTTLGGAPSSGECGSFVDALHRLSHGFLQCILATAWNELSGVAGGSAPDTTDESVLHILTTVVPAMKADVEMILRDIRMLEREQARSQSQASSGNNGSTAAALSSSWDGLRVQSALCLEMVIEAPRPNLHATPFGRQLQNFLVLFDGNWDASFPTVVSLVAQMASPETCARFIVVFLQNFVLQDRRNGGVQDNTQLPLILNFAVSVLLGIDMFENPAGSLMPPKIHMATWHKTLTLKRQLVHLFLRPSSADFTTCSTAASDNGTSTLLKEPFWRTLMACHRRHTSAAQTADPLFETIQLCAEIYQELLSNTEGGAVPPLTEDDVHLVLQMDLAATKQDASKSAQAGNMQAYVMALAKSKQHVSTFINGVVTDNALAVSTLYAKVQCSEALQYLFSESNSAVLYGLKGVLKSSGTGAVLDIICATVGQMPWLDNVMNIKALLKSTDRRTRQEMEIVESLGFAAVHTTALLANGEVGNDPKYEPTQFLDELDHEADLGHHRRLYEVVTNMLVAEKTRENRASLNADLLQMLTQPQNNECAVIAGVCAALQRSHNTAQVHVVAPALQELVGPTLSHKANAVLSANLELRNKANTPKHGWDTRLCILQFTTHASMVALSFPGSYPHAVLFKLLSLTPSFIPSCEASQADSITNAMAYVQWYACPKGHPYTVGECGRPMERGICGHPGCGATIGGLSHNVTKGNRTIQRPKFRMNGYHLDSMKTYTSQGTRLRCSELVTAFLRLFLHCLLTLNPATETGFKQKMGTGGGPLPAKKPLRKGPEAPGEKVYKRNDPLGNTNKRYKAFGVDYSKLQQLVCQDWRKCISLLQVPASEASFLLHVMLMRMPLVLKHFHTAVFNNGECELFEQLVSREVVDYVRRDQHALLQRMHEFSNSDLDLTFKQNMSPESWFELKETRPEDEDDSAAPSGVSAAGACLWRFRRSVSLAHFEQFFGEFATNHAMYPLISTLLEERRRLPFIPYLADVLDWHAVLFEAFGADTLGTTITRQDAASITNDEAIELMPPSKRHDARAALERYCVAFNTCLPLLENIYECQKNPFLRSGGGIDLSGMGLPPDQGGQVMSGRTPVSFSLPSMLPGETDAAGLCTIGLITVLQTSHNGVIERLYEQVDVNSGDAAQEGPVDGEGEHVGEVLTHRSPSRHIRNCILTFDVDVDMAPLLQLCSQQSLCMGEGQHLSYNLRLLEDSLKYVVLNGKRLVEVNVEHFRFSGEIRQAGDLSTLSLRVPQVSLPYSVALAIKEELDTRDQLQRLFQFVEAGVHLLASMGGGDGDSKFHIDGNMKLEDFLHKVMGIGGDDGPGDGTLPAGMSVPSSLSSSGSSSGGVSTSSQSWVECRPNVVAEYVRLCHLQDLYLCVEEKLEGGPLACVELKYRTQLGCERRDELRGIFSRKGSEQLDIKLLQPVLRDLLVGPLTSTTWPHDAPLKLYLTFQDADLADMAWFENGFPDDLMLEHSCAVYEVIVDLLG